jgi:histone deacetylase complex regulatory component SIN3
VNFEDSLDFGDTVHPCDVSVILEVLALNSYDIDKAKKDMVSRVSEFVEDMMKKKSAETGGKQGEIGQTGIIAVPATTIPLTQPLLRLAAEGSSDTKNTHNNDTSMLSSSSAPISSSAAVSETTPLSYSNPTPQLAMFWTKNEKSLFDAGFKKHAGQLRHISLGLPSKSTSEVIDYHYRFKIPSQYRKYVEKKRTTSSANGTGGSTSSTPFSSTSNSPFDNGSGPSAIDRRRHKQAKSFLSQCRRQLGPEAYLSVVNLLKSYSQKSIHMKNLRERVVKVIGGGELAKNFDTFLPKKYRSEGGA